LLGSQRQFGKDLHIVHRSVVYFSAHVTFPSCLSYGSSLLISRGKRQASRILSQPKSCIVSRSSPIPSPPWGGMPKRKASTYCFSPSSVIPRFPIFSSSFAASWILWPPVVTSSPLKSRSKLNVYRSSDGSSIA